MNATPTSTRTLNGRNRTRLPRSENPQVTFGNSREIAKRRLEIRLRKVPHARKSHARSMDECARLSHMQGTDPVHKTTPHRYLPHHSESKESSTSGFALNDTLAGSVLLQDPLSIVVRSCIRPIANVANADVLQLSRLKPRLSDDGVMDARRRPRSPCTNPEAALRQLTQGSQQRESTTSPVVSGTNRHSASRSGCNKNRRASDSRHTTTATSTRVPETAKIGRAVRN